MFFLLYVYLYLHNWHGEFIIMLDNVKSQNCMQIRTLVNKANKEEDDSKAEKCTKPDGE